MRAALLSVSDKSGLEPLATALVASGYVLLSTGGTAKALRAAGLDVVDVASFTGAPEMMDGRVKTLHPKVHGGILARRDRDEGEMAAHGIVPIDVVVANLYPFERTAGGSASRDAIVEEIDIGGPAMVRAAAKNHRWVTVVVDPADYGRVIGALGQGGAGEELRRELAARAFRHTSRYDAVVARWMGGDGYPEEFALPLRLRQPLRYGENPHQRAAFYDDGEAGGRSLARAIWHGGKSPSFNNLADLDAAVRSVFEFAEPACCIVKHMNPCGLATGQDMASAYEGALAGDPVSAFGGIVAYNRPFDVDAMKALRQSKVFFEVLAAPGFEPLALERLLATRKDLRVVELPGDWAEGRPGGADARRIQGGWLIQSWDHGAEPGWEVRSARAPTPEEDAALRFAWRVVRSVKSNGIAFAVSVDGGHRLNGVGAGQMSRVDSVKLAVAKATVPVAGNVLASDAFFPFADGVRVALDAGITAIVQPGGSMRDDEIIAAADAAGAALVFTGVRHFRH